MKRNCSLCLPLPLRTLDPCASSVLTGCPNESGVDVTRNKAGKIIREISFEPWGIPTMERMIVLPTGRGQMRSLRMGGFPAWMAALWTRFYICTHETDIHVLLREIPIITEGLLSPQPKIGPHGKASAARYSSANDPKHFRRILPTSPNHGKTHFLWYQGRPSP